MPVRPYEAIGIVLKPIWCGVPQGSIIGPILFLLYTANLSSVVQSHGHCCHLYADDTRIYGYCRPHAMLELTVSVS